MKLILFAVLLITGDLVSSLPATSFDCVQTEQWQDIIRNEMAKVKMGDISEIVEEKMCRTVWKALDQLIQVSSSCVGKGEDDHRRLGEDIMEARRFLESECEDKSGKWTESICYRSVSERCNGKFESKMSDKLTMVESCGIYETYKQCVDEALTTDKCSNTERLFVSIFMLDQAKDLVYSCPNPIQAEQELPPTLPVPQAFSISDTLSNLACWDPLKLKEPIKKCKDAYEEEIKKTSVVDVVNPLEKKGFQKKQCCLYREMEHCIEVAVKETCGDKTGEVINTIVKKYKDMLSGPCDDYKYGEPPCSASITLQPMMTAIVALLAVLFSLKFLRDL